jgi:hypothetical protein
MTDPPRLIQSCSDDFARAVLSSSRDDAGSSSAYQRTLASLGVGATVELAAEGAANAAVATLAPAAKLGFAGFMKLLSVGAALGVATVAGLELTITPAATPVPVPSASLRDDLPVPVQPAAQQALRSPAPVLEPAPATAPARSIRSTASPPVPSSVDPTPVAAESASSAEFDARPPSVASSALEREVHGLDAVKQALRRGDAREALSALGAYEREFAQGALAPEAQVLRVRTLLAAGDREAAQQAARRVIEADPNGRHAAVVRALLARDANP